MLASSTQTPSHPSSLRVGKHMSGHPFLGTSCPTSPPWGVDDLHVTVPLSALSHFLLSPISVFTPWHRASHPNQTHAASENGEQSVLWG